MSLNESMRTAIGKVAALGSLPSDAPDEQLRKSALVLSSLLITSLSLIWVGTYAALGLLALRADSAGLPGRIRHRPRFPG